MVGVVVKNGVVHLTGVLTDERERYAINVLVENIDGVRTLHDHIHRRTCLKEPLSEKPMYRRLLGTGLARQFGCCIRHVEPPI